MEEKVLREAPSYYGIERHVVGGVGCLRRQLAEAQDELARLREIVGKLRPSDKPMSGGWRYSTKFLKAVSERACAELGDDAYSLCWEDIETAIRYGFKVAAAEKARKDGRQ